MQSRYAPCVAVGAGGGEASKLVSCKPDEMGREKEHNKASAESLGRLVG